MEKLLITPDVVKQAYRKMIYAILCLIIITILCKIAPDEIPNFITRSLQLCINVFVLYIINRNFKIVYKWIEYRNAFVKIADEMKALGFVYDSSDIEEFVYGHYKIIVRFDNLNKYKVFYNAGTGKICISNRQELLNTVKSLINQIKTNETSTSY